MEKLYLFMNMKKLYLLLILSFFFSASAFGKGAPGTGTNASTFIRTVKNGRLQHQETSADHTFDSDANNINHISKMESSTSTTSTDNTAGIISKGYISGNIGGAGKTEIVGGASWIKNTATQNNGSKSAIHTFHNHADSTTPVERGLAVFGDVTSLLYSSGTQTNFAKLVSGNEGVSTGSTKTSPSTVNKWLVVEIAGTTHYVPCYTSKTS